MHAGNARHGALSGIWSGHSAPATKPWPVSPPAHGTLCTRRQHKPANEQNTNQTTAGRMVQAQRTASAWRTAVVRRRGAAAGSATGSPTASPITARITTTSRGTDHAVQRRAGRGRNLHAAVGGRRGRSRRPQRLGLARHTCARSNGAAPRAAVGDGIRAAVGDGIRAAVGDGVRAARAHRQASVRVTGDCHPRG